MSKLGPVLLAHSLYLNDDPKQRDKMKPYSPLATLITAAVVRDAGYRVALFDAMLASGVEEFTEALVAVRPAVVAIVEDNFNFLTKMCTARMREAATTMIAAARAQGARIIVNGSDASDNAELYTNAGADVVIVGEPEEAISLVLAHWDAGSENLEDIRGVIFQRNGVLESNSFRAQIDDLDALPLPAWDLLDTARYRAAWTGAHGRVSWNVVTSRGCPYRCNWCAKPVFGSRYAQRSPTRVAEELGRLKAEIGPDHIWFADDIFGLTGDWIEVFSQEVVARDAVTPFTMQSRVNLMQAPVVDALARAGAEDIWLGVESGSQQILDAMDKGTRIAQIRQATRFIKGAGIRACWFIQLGYVGETWPDILMTRDLIRSERPDEIGVSVSYPLPGTKFHDMVREQLDIKTNWEDSDDLSMMFHGTYVTEFYRLIRRALHREVRFGRGVEVDRQWGELERLEPLMARSPAEVELSGNP